MQTFLKPSVSSQDHLYFLGDQFQLAVSVERGRERVLFLRDEAAAMPSEAVTLGQAGDLGFKVQRELRQGRDVFVLSGQLVEHPSDDAAMFTLERADLHVRPEIVEATRKLVDQNAPVLRDRLVALASRAVEETLSRTGRPLKVVQGTGAATDGGVADEGVIVTGVTNEEDFIDPDLLELMPISDFF